MSEPSAANSARTTLQLKNAWEALGIDQQTISQCQLPLQEEIQDPVSAGLDIFDREQFIAANTLKNWRKMKAAAEQDDITLQLVSAYRSIDYQCQLIRNKLDKGEQIGDILRVNAIPGFSEHHTGRALDLSEEGCEPLTEAFENTAAFHWLSEHAAKFQFTLSFPRNNPMGIIYEPWHWACQVK